MLLADLSPEELIAEVPRLHELAAALLAERAAPRSEGESWLPLPVPSTTVAVVNRVRISRVGQFSCPLSVGAVFLSTPATPLVDVQAGRAWLETHAESLSGEGEPSEHAPLRLLDGCLTVEEVQSLAHCPPILCSGESLAGSWVVFRPRPPHAPADAPWPVTWFSFRTRENAAELVARGRDLLASDQQPPDESEWATELVAARMWEADEDAFDILDIAIPAPHSGSVLSAALIAPEDLMESWGDDHDEPNIDATSIGVSGALADYTTATVR